MHDFEIIYILPTLKFDNIGHKMKKKIKNMIRIYEYIKIILINTQTYQNLYNNLNTI